MKGCVEPAYQRKVGRRVVDGPIQGYLWGKKPGPRRPPGPPRKIAMQKETPKGDDRTPVLTVKNVSYY